MEDRPGQVRSTSSLRLVHDPKVITSEMFPLEISRQRAESLRSFVLGHALPLSLRTVQDAINLRCRPHKTLDCLVSSSSRTFLPSRDRFSPLFPLPGLPFRKDGVMTFTRRVRLKRGLALLLLESTVEMRTCLSQEFVVPRSCIP